MSTVTQTRPAVPILSGGLVPYRLSVDQYEAMIRAGVFTKRDRLELIEGLLVAKMTKGTMHSTASEKCRRTIERIIPPIWHVRAEKPVRVPGRASEPEPDLSVARGDIDAYKLRNPDAGEVPLVVEIAESSIVADRTEMARIYGGGGIPLYWIVNLVDGQIEEYSDPDPAGGYRTRTDYHPGQSISVTLEGLDLGKVAVAHLLP